MKLQEALRDFTVSDAINSWKILPTPKERAVKETPVKIPPNMSEKPLVAGQIIRYGPALYRVDYVNECRARIVPLGKKQVSLPDGREFEAERGGINIGPNSAVEIITDLDRARDEMELEAVEAELRATKAELIRRETEHVSVVVAPKPVAHRREAVRPGGGWFLANVATPAFKEGTLAETVWLFIGTHPGLSTAGIVEGVKATGAVAACVSRFHQAGLIEKK